MLLYAVPKIFLLVASVKIVPKIAIPKDPAMFLPKAKTEEAIPISFTGTTTVMPFVRCDIPKPIPKAIKDNGQITA